MQKKWGEHNLLNCNAKKNFILKSLDREGTYLCYNYKRKMLVLEIKFQESLQGKAAIFHSDFKRTSTTCSTLF